MADLRRIMGLIAGTVLSTGVAAVALWSVYHAWHQPARIAAENGYLSAMLDPQQPRPAAPSTLEPPAVRLAGRPLDSGALSQAALEATLAGRSDVARPIMQEVVRRNPRAKAGRIWLMADALRRGDLRTATGHIERLMAIDPTQSLGYFPILADIAKQRGGERRHFGRLVGVGVVDLAADRDGAGEVRLAHRRHSRLVGGVTPWTCFGCFSSSVR